MLKAIIFDLDGIIIDSEPLWIEAEIKVYGSVGFNLTSEMCRQTTGLDSQAAIRYWYNRYPWKDKSVFQIYKEIMEEMQVLFQERAELKEGFLDVLQLIKDFKLPVAVASSSPLKLITAALKKFHLFDFFKVINSGENEEFGKPHPVVYINTARKLNVEPIQCLAFEDSFNGAIAAKAARMKVVAIPDEHDINTTRFDFTDLKLPSLKEFKSKQFEFLNSL